MTIGITGGIGSGKSTIARELGKRGFVIYDCDHEAKRIIAEDKGVQREIAGLLGEEAFIDGSYNTAYVAQRVFGDPTLLSALNGIIHPKIKEDICHRKPDFVESAILYEAGLDSICDKIVIVEAPEEVRIARTIHRDYADRADVDTINKVRARIRAQKTSVRATSRRPILTVINDGTSILSSIIDLICDFAAR